MILICINVWLRCTHFCFWSQLDVDILFVFKSKCTTFHKSILKCKVGKVVLHITNNSTHTHTHTTVLRPSSIFFRTNRESRHQKGKTNLDLPEQEIVSGNGISWAICKSAPWHRHITMPASHHSVFLQAGCPSCHPTNSVKALKA